VEATQARDFRELWSLTVGSGSSWCVDFMIMGVAAGALLVYSCFLGEILASVLGGGRRFVDFALIRCFGAAPAYSHF
jgi:amino acid permease